MACQKVCKQGRDDIKAKVFHTKMHDLRCKKKCGDRVLYHPYLVCILFGMPSLHFFCNFLKLELHLYKPNKQRRGGGGGGGSKSPPKYNKPKMATPLMCNNIKQNASVNDASFAYYPAP